MLPVVPSGLNIAMYIFIAEVGLVLIVVSCLQAKSGVRISEVLYL
jgi:hypothetical protein